MPVHCNERDFLARSIGRDNWCVHQNGLHNSGAIERRAVVFSWVMFGPRDLYSSGVGRSGGHYPTHAFFPFRSASVSSLWWTPIFFYKKHEHFFWKKILKEKKANKTWNRMFFKFTSIFLKQDPFLRRRNGHFLNLWRIFENENLFWTSKPFSNVFLVTNVISNLWTFQ